MTAITAALIVRNEERFLPECLRSLELCVDAIVVVDTGSTDATIDIARSAGASVSTFAWTGDFAAARNAALDRVETAWTLYIDADERVTVPGGGRIGPLLDPARHAGGFVRFRPRPGYTRYREPRLFRSDPSIRFEGHIHEDIVPSLLRYKGRHGLTLATTSVLFDHYGFEGDQSHKVARNVPMLREEIKAHPERGYCWNHLAEMLELGGRRDEAIAACEQGLARTQDTRPAKYGGDRRQIGQTLARLLIEAHRDATAVIVSLLDESPDDYATLYLAGRNAVLLGDAQGALTMSRRLTGVDPDRLEDSLTAYDTRLFGEFAWELQGAAYALQGQRLKAAEAYRQAWQHAPDKPSYLAKAVALGAVIAPQVLTAS